MIAKKYDAFDRVTEVNNYMSALVPAAPNEPAWKSSVYSIAKYNYILNNNGDKTKTEFLSNCDKTNTCNQGIEVRSTDDYTYDVLGRLLSNTHTINAGANDSVEPRSYSNFYTYDEVGNRTGLISTRTGAAVTTNSTYNLNNQLLTETGGDQNWSYSYDDNGNRLSKTNSSTTEFVSMSWDRANNMVGVDSKLKNENGQLEDYRVSYKYDAFGRRVTRDPDSTVQNSAYNNIVSQSYVYDRNSWDMTSEYTDIENGSNVHTNYYMAKLNDGGVPALIAAEDVIERAMNYDPTSWDRTADESSSELDPEHNFIVSPDNVQRFAYYQRDALDSIVSKTNLEVRYKASDSTGTFVIDPALLVNEVFKVNNQNRTDEYGRRLNDTQTTPEITVNENWASRGYSGQVYDVESQAYYYGSRNYDPTNGTWTKLDTYRGEYKSPLSRNRYIFVEDDPVNSVDEYGFWGWKDIKKAANRVSNWGQEQARKAYEQAQEAARKAQEYARQAAEAAKQAAEIARQAAQKAVKTVKTYANTQIKKTASNLKYVNKKLVQPAVKKTIHNVRQAKAGIVKATQAIKVNIPVMPSLSEVNDYMKELGALGSQANSFGIGVLTGSKDPMMAFGFYAGLAERVVDIPLGMMSLASSDGLAMEALGIDLPFDTQYSKVEQKKEKFFRETLGVGNAEFYQDDHSIVTKSFPGLANANHLVDKDLSAKEQGYLTANMGFDAAEIVMIAESAHSGIKGLRNLAKGKNADYISNVTKDINPTKGTHNCGRCVVATDSTLAGRPASAMPGGPDKVADLEKLYGNSFTKSSQKGIEATLLEHGEGSRGIVYGSRGKQLGHVFNAVNKGGSVIFIDGQIGKEASFIGYTGIHFMPTNF